MRLRFSLLLALALVAPAGAAGHAPAPIRVNIFSEVHSLLPIFGTSTDEGEIGGLIFDDLIEFDSQRRPQPELAAVVPTLANGGISADGRTIVMHLRRGVRWHDGAPFTSADVAFTIHAILDPANNVGDSALYRNVARVDTPGPYTVVFHLKAPQSSVLAAVGATYPMLPAHLLAKSSDLAKDPFNAHPVGTGPYRFARWLRGQRIEVTPNATYFRGAPKNGGVTVVELTDSNTLAIAIREHEIDFAQVESSTYNTLRGVPGVVRTTEPVSDFNAVAFNEKRPVLADVRVRRALTLAIDRARIAKTVSFGTGTPAYADLPLFMYDGHPPAGWQHADPAAAGALLAAAGWLPGPDGIRAKDGAPLQLEMIGFAGSATLANVALQMQAMLRPVGVVLDYKTYDPGLYYSQASAGGPLDSGNFDLGVISFTNGVDPDNSVIYACASRPPLGFNYANYCSPAMDGLLKASQREYDPLKRNRIIAQIETLAAHDAPYLYLYHTPYRFAYSTALKRVPSTLDDRWYDIRDWTIAR
jgi:peptide/nickel transport system substrate-binding protein